MLLLCVVFALITVGLVVPCLIDIATTSRHDFDLPSKRTWLTVVAVCWAFGAAAWLLAGRRDVLSRRQWDGDPGRHGYERHGARQHRVWRRPAASVQFADAVLGRRAAAAPFRCVAPDDNPEFLLELDRRIREWRDDD